MIQPLCRQELLPLIERAVDEAFEGITIITKLSMPKLVAVLDRVNQAVLEKLFSVDLMTTDKTLGNESDACNRSFDSFESEEPNQRSWLVGKFCEYFSKTLESFD